MSDNPLYLLSIISNQIAADRRKRFATSDQLSLGELISRIEPLTDDEHITAMIKKYDSEPTVVYDFEYLYPTKLDSWRGSYNELALNFTSQDINSNSKPMTVRDFLKMLKEAIGKEFIGYKGGEFIMDRLTPIWVSNYGNAGETAIIDIIDNEFEVILITARRAF